MNTEKMVMDILSGGGLGYNARPVMQIHIWLHVNFLREREGKKPIDRLNFSKVMSRMKAKGTVLQDVWFSQCDGNVWRLNKKSNA